MKLYWLKSGQLGFEKAQTKTIWVDNGQKRKF